MAKRAGIKVLHPFGTIMVNSMAGVIMTNCEVIIFFPCMYFHTIYAVRACFAVRSISFKAAGAVFLVGCSGGTGFGTGSGVSFGEES